MTLAVQTEVSDGSLTSIQVGIDFFEQDNIQVYLDLSESALVAGTDYSWTTSNTITFTNAPLAAGVTVFLIRQTEIDEMLNIYDGGAGFTRATLDENFKQILLLAQEVREGVGLRGIFLPLDMNGYRITSLGDPVDDEDATNKGYVDGLIAIQDARNNGQDVRLDALSAGLPGTNYALPWSTTTTSATKTIAPPYTFSSALLFLDGVAQTLGQAYTVADNVITLAEGIPSGTKVFAILGQTLVPSDTASLAQLAGPDGAELIGYEDGTVADALVYLASPHDHLIFKKKLIGQMAMRNPEWDWLLSTYNIRAYPQTMCLDEYSNKLLVIDGTAATKAVLVYNWPDLSFDRVFIATGGLVSEGAVVKMEGSTKYLYLRTTGDKLAKYDITTYPAARSSIAESVITTTQCGLNFMERNGVWTISDVGNSELGNVRSRGKFAVTDSDFNTMGVFDCGDYNMGIYAGRDGDTSVTKTQGVTDTGYGIVAQMGGQWVSPATVTPYMQNGLRVFTYDGDLVSEGLMNPAKFAAKINSVWGTNATVVESEGIFTDSAGNVFTLTVTSNNGTDNASTTDGFLIMQEFCPDGVDFSDCAAPRLGRFQVRNTPVTTPAGSIIVDPTNPGVAVTTLQGLLVAMQRAGIETWSSYTTGLTITDPSGAAYPAGNVLRVYMARSDIYYTWLKGNTVDIWTRVYYDTATSSWIYNQSYFSDGTTTFSASGITIARTSGGPTFVLNGPTATIRQMIGQTSGSARWRLALGDSVAESGSNVGSNFALARYTDAGVLIDTPLQVIRSTGAVQVALLTATSATITTGTVTTLTSTNGTIATLNSTNGTIATLNSTTGTVVTLNSTNATITTVAATNLTIGGLGIVVAPGAIHGLNLGWAANSITVSPGAAYIGTSMVQLANTATVSLSGLTAGTFYHAYLYSGGIELSSTAPVAATYGGYNKTGDTTRRYLGSVLADSATTVYRFIHIGGDTIEYNVNATVFNIIAGTATTATSVSCDTAVPPTAITIKGIGINAGAAVARIGNADLGTVSTSLYRQFVPASGTYPLEILLVGQAFTYIFDSAPTGALSFRASGYKFKR